MAKKKSELDPKEIDVILKKYNNLSKANADTSNELLKVSKELKKAVAILEAGFIKSREDAENFVDQVYKGLKVTDDYAAKLADKSGATNYELASMIKKFRIIEKLDAKKLKTETDINQMMFERNEALQDELDFSSKLLVNQQKILEIVAQRKKDAELFANEFRSADDILKSFISKEVDLSGMLDDPISQINNFEDMVGKVNDDLKSMINFAQNQSIYLELEFDPLSDELTKQLDAVKASIDKEKQYRLDALAEYFKESETASSGMAKKLAAEMSGGKVKFDIDTGEIKTKKGSFMPTDAEYDAQSKVLERIIEKNDLMAVTANIQKEILDIYAAEGSLTSAQLDRLNELKNSLAIGDKILIEQVEHRIFTLRKTQEELFVQKDIGKVLFSNMKTLKNMGGVVDRIGSAFDYINEILPLGIGNFLGLQQASYDLTNAHQKGIESFVAKYKETQSTSQAFAAYSAEIRSTLSGMINPITAVVAGLALMFKFSESITAKYKEMSSALSTSLTQNREILKTQYETLTSYNNQFATMSDIQEIQTAMIGSTGKVFELTEKGAQDTVIQLSNLAKLFGLSNEEAVNLNKTFKMIGADDKLALRLETNLLRMTELAGLSPKIVSQDLIDSADTVATYFAGMPEKAVEAAIEVRKMGMSLKQAGSIAQKMLNLEGFMTDMYELYAMTGTDIDFSEAFEKGLSGDIKGMTKSIVDQIGSLEEFNDMHYTTKMKMASTLGMSVEELAKMVKMNEDMSKYDKDQQKWLQDNYATIKDYTMLSKEEVENKINSGMATDRLAVAWEKIKGVLTMSILPLVESFAEGIDAISPAIDIIIGGFKVLGTVVSFIAPIIKGMFYPFKLAGELLSPAVKYIEEFYNKISDGKPLLDGMSAGLENIGKVIGSLLTGFVIFYKPVREKFTSLFSSIFSAVPVIGKMFSGAGSNVKNTTDQMTQTVASMTDGVKSSMSEMITSIQSMMKDMTDSIRQSFQQMKGEAASAGDVAKQVSKDVSTKVVDSTIAAGDQTVATNKKVEKSVEEVKKKINKDANNSLISKAVAGKTGKLIRDIGIKAIATWGVKSAIEMVNFRKEGEQQTGLLGEHMETIMGAATGGLGALIGTYLTDSIEKVFVKNMEKTFDTALDKPLSETFKGVAEKGKGAFSKLGGFVKNIFNIPQTATTGSFDQMATSAKKAVEPLSTVKEITEEIKTKQEKVSEKFTSAQEIIQPKMVKDESGTKKMTPKSAKDVGADVEKPIRSIGSKMQSGFDFVKNVLTSAWDGVKTIATDIVKFLTDSLNTISKSMATILKNISGGIADVMKNLSKGIGETINNVLSGIGKGLSSFKTSAVKGAAALAIVSGALWVTSKAIQNFADLDLEDLTLAGAALVGLGAAAYAASKMAPALTEGSFAIAVMGAALIPFGYAINLIGENIDKFVPLVAAFGDVISKVFSGISSVIQTASAGISNIFNTLAGIDVVHLLAIGPALAGIGAGLAILGGGSVISGIGSAISSVFGGDPIDDLERFAALADPLTVVNNVLKELGATFSTFAASIESVNTDAIAKIADMNLGSFSGIVSPQFTPRTPTATAMNPPRESVGQNKSIGANGVYNVSDDGKKISTGNTYNQSSQNQNFYDNDTDMVSDNVETNMLLRQMVQLMNVLVKKDTSLILDGQRVNTITKKYNNNN